jgi:hypothetical protein
VILIDCSENSGVIIIIRSNVYLSFYLYIDIIYELLVAEEV